MEYQEEMNVHEMLSNYWVKIYDARKTLGRDHPEYEELCLLLQKVNAVICCFHKYDVKSLQYPSRQYFQKQ